MYCAIGLATTRMANWREKLVLAEFHFGLREEIHGWRLNIRLATCRPVGQISQGSSVRNGTNLVLDVETGEDLRTFKGHHDQVWSIVFSPDGRTALSASLDGTMKLWDVTR